jgi:hypothetical protein
MSQTKAEEEAKLYKEWKSGGFKARKGKSHEAKLLHSEELQDIEVK